MPLADGLRAERLKRLHTRLLDAAEKHGHLRHVAIEAHYVLYVAGQRPFDDPVEGETFPIGLDDRTSYCVARACNLHLTVVGGPHIGPLHGRTALLRFDSAFWYGLFHTGNTMLGRFESPDDTDVFGELATELADLFCPPVRRLQFPFPYDQRWLELVYGLFPDYRSSYEAHGENVKAAWLPCNVFLASAQAIELLAETPTTACADGAEADRADGHRDTLRRPAYERDQLWLAWRKQGLTPASVRDRWNAMSDDERQSVCPRKWQKIESDGGPEGERDLIEKALKRAAAEQGETGEN